MPKQRLRALLIEDCEFFQKLVVCGLRDADHTQVFVHPEETLTAGLAALREGRWDVVLADLNLPDSAGLATVRSLRAAAPSDVPIIVLTGVDSEESGIEAIKAGAQDYLLKDRVDGELLYRAMRYAMERATVEQALRESQARLFHAQKMDALGRLAGGFAQHMSDTLTTIIAHAAFLTDEARSDQQDDLRVITKVAEGGCDLASQILAFGRRHALDRAVVDPNHFIRECVALLAPTVANELELTVDLQPNVGLVNLDTGQLEQALVNLVMNARRAVAQTREAPHVRVGSRRVSLRSPVTIDAVAVPAGEYVLLSVWDNGPGMTPMVRRRCFEPYFKTWESGAGLGLATVYGIVKRHNGFIWARGGPERGTTFDIYLPCTSEITGAATVQRCARAVSWHHGRGECSRNRMFGSVWRRGMPHLLGAGRVRGAARRSACDYRVGWGLCWRRHGGDQRVPVCRRRGRPFCPSDVEKPAQRLSRAAAFAPQGVSARAYVSVGDRRRSRAVRHGGNRVCGPAANLSRLYRAGAATHAHGPGRAARIQPLEKGGRAARGADGLSGYRHQRVRVSGGRVAG